jgi:hypothetical protein
MSNHDWKLGIDPFWHQISKFDLFLGFELFPWKIATFAIPFPPNSVCRRSIIPSRRGRLCENSQRVLWWMSILFRAAAFIHVSFVCAALLIGRLCFTARWNFSSHASTARGGEDARRSAPENPFYFFCFMFVSNIAEGKRVITQSSAFFQQPDAQQSAPHFTSSGGGKMSIFNALEIWHFCGNSR